MKGGKVDPMEFLTRETYERDLDQTLDLFAQAFGRPIPREFLVWRYLDNPAGGPEVCVAREEGAIIGSYSVSPVWLDCAGEARPTALSMTTMTHPAHNGKGIFKTLATSLYDRLAAGYDLVWGFPNFNSHFAFANRLAWKDIYEVPTLVLGLRDAAIDAPAPERDDAFECDYRQARRAESIAVRKDRDYLRWRYGRNPINRYQTFVVKEGDEVASFAIVKTFGDGLDLVDLQAASDEQADLLVRQVIQHAKAAGLASIATWCPVHASSHKVFEKLGFENRAPITYFGARALRAGQGAPDWYDRRNWYIQMGDSDVY
jgi:hypothetical protein